jgi:mRNA-degrading endonuclease RelE of RelBE toxin-antitoxin system
MWNELITVAETPTFMRQADAVWSKKEREAFVDFIARNPEAGDVIPETGGVRKIRWRMQGGGKRGGTRVIYFFYDRETPIYLLMVYAKRVNENISPEAKKQLREFATRIKQMHRRREGQRHQ